MIDPGAIRYVEMLGKGNFGEVWKAAIGDELVAIKILGDATEAERKECSAEAHLTSNLNHENVVRMKGVTFWARSPAEKPKLLIVLEFCNYGSLDKLLEKGLLSKLGTLPALLDAAIGIEYLHKRDIIHSRNCLVVRSGDRNTLTVKIGDFGLSRLAPNHYQMTTRRHSPIFSTPPDTLQAREWTSASDVWSYGILIHAVFNDSVNPYERHLLREAGGRKVDIKHVKDTLNGGFRIQAPSGTPKEVADVVDWCLQKDRQNRPTMTQVVAALEKFYDAFSRT